MVRIVKYKLKGSILEPLIALMIIFFSLTAAFFVVTNMRDQNNMQQTVRAAVWAEKVLSNAVMDNDYLSAEIEEEGLKLEKSIEWYDKERKLLQISINVFDNRSKTLVTIKKIVIYDEEETE